MQTAYERGEINQKEAVALAELATAVSRTIPEQLDGIKAEWLLEDDPWTSP